MKKVRMQKRKRFFNVTRPEGFRFTLIQWKRVETFKLYENVIQSANEFFYFLPIQPTRVVFVEEAYMNRARYPFQIIRKAVGFGFFDNITIYRENDENSN